MRKLVSKFLYLIIYCSFLTTLLVGCGSSEKSVKEIKEDLNNSGLVTEYAYEGEDYYEITELEVIKRNTQDEFMDDVYVYFEMENDVRKASGELELIYNYYTTGGWILDGIYPMNDFVYAPLVGADEYFADSELYYWGYDEYTLKKHKTDLENMIDCLTYDVSSDGKMYSIEGTLDMMYAYDSTIGGWVFDGILAGEDYKEVWNEPGTYVQEESILGPSFLYYFDYIEGGILYGKKFFVDSNAVTNATSEQWEDVEWVVDFTTMTLTRLEDNKVLSFDKDGLYTQYGNPYTKVSDGCVDPKAYTESINHTYHGPDIGGAPVIMDR